MQCATKLTDQPGLRLVQDRRVHDGHDHVRGRFAGVPRWLLCGVEQVQDRLAANRIEFVNNR